MKYIVEFEDEPCMREDGLNFYKCIQAPWYQLSDLMIKRLAPYQPERNTGNTGEWREHIFDGIMGGRPRALMCTKCNVISIYASNFCPNCGADMRKVNES